MSLSPEHEKKEPSHSYKNLRTGQEKLFFFVATEHKFLWNLVTVEGELIGEWNKKSRLYYMKHGLSCYAITKLKGNQQ